MIFYLRLPLFSIQSNFVANSNPKPLFTNLQKKICVAKQKLWQWCVLHVYYSILVFLKGKPGMLRFLPCAKTEPSTYNRRVWLYKVSSARSPFHNDGGWKLKNLGNEYTTEMEKENHRLKSTKLGDFLVPRKFNVVMWAICKFKDSKSLLNNIDIFMIHL